MGEDGELDKYLKEYEWVREELLPTYYALECMGSKSENGYLFLPTSIDNLLSNLKTKRSKEDFDKEVVQLFSEEYIEEKEVNATYIAPPPDGVYTYSYKFKEMKIKGSLWRIAKEQWEKSNEVAKGSVEPKFTINNILELLILKRISSIIEPLDAIGFLKIDIQRMEDKELFPLSIGNPLFDETILQTCIGDVNKSNASNILNRTQHHYKASAYFFNSSGIIPWDNAVYAIPSSVWDNYVKPIVEPQNFKLIINESLEGLKEEVEKILRGKKFLELLKQNKVEANRRMKIEDYDQFSDIIKLFSAEGVIKVIPTGDIILLKEKFDTYVRRWDAEYERAVKRFLESDIAGAVEELTKKAREKSVDEPAEVEKTEIPKKPTELPTKPHINGAFAPKEVSETSPTPSPRDEKEIKVLIGMADNGSEVFWEPSKLLNGHFIIVGGSGAGKTETLRCLAYELSKQDMPVLIVDFHGDVSNSEVFSEMDIKTYDMKERGEGYFNPLELSPRFEDMSPLRTRSDFVDAIAMNFKKLGDVQIGILKETIDKAYKEKGITDDYSTWSKELEFDEIVETLLQSDEKNIHNFGIRLGDIRKFKVFSGTQRISIEDVLKRDITHLKLNGLPETLRFLFADLFLRKLLYSLQALGTSKGFRLFVIVDEAKLLAAKKGDNKAVLNKYSTEMRKFGVGLILSSQFIQHFDDEILGNAETKLCMKAGTKKEAEKNRKYFGVKSDELLKLRQGEGISPYNDKKRKVRVIPTRERKKVT